MKSKWLWAAAALMGLAAGRAEAANPSYLYIDVTIASGLSVSVGNAAVSTSATVGSYTGPASLMGATGVAVTVKNDSTFVPSRWELTTTATSMGSTSGNAGWTLGTAQGSETAVLEALFVTALTNCPPVAAAEWTATGSAAIPALTSAAQTWYTSTTLIDSTPLFPDVLATSRMDTGSTRGLCWKLWGPTSTLQTDTQVVPVIVTAF